MREDHRSQIDWGGLRAAAVAVGIRKAARQAARDLPPDEQERFVQRAMKRCSREKWLVKSEQVKADAVATSPTALSANVRKGSDVLSQIFAEDSRETRIGLSAAARKGAEHLANSHPETILGKHQALASVTNVAAKVHNWNADQRPGSELNLNVLGGRTVICVHTKEEYEQRNTESQSKSD